MSCEEAREALGGYVLGALDPYERAVVAAHLGACPECARSTPGSRRCRPCCGPPRGS